MILTVVVVVVVVVVVCDVVRLPVPVDSMSPVDAYCDGDDGGGCDKYNYNEMLMYYSVWNVWYVRLYRTQIRFRW